jgi:hypothetical protein
VRVSDKSISLTFTTINHFFDASLILYELSGDTPPLKKYEVYMNFFKFVAGLTYLNFICMFLMPIASYMYISSVIIGIGAACIWTAQGAFLHHQSPNPQLMSRNTGIFWCMLQFRLH